MNEKEEIMVKMMICTFESRPQDSLNGFDLKKMNSDLLNCWGGGNNDYNDDGSSRVLVPLGPGVRLTTCANFQTFYPTSQNIIIYNFLFNRTKAYYSGLEFQAKPWYYEDPACYQGVKLTTGRNKNKVFINPAKFDLRQHHKQKRREISYFLKPYNGYRSYIPMGNPDQLREMFDVQGVKPLYLGGMADHRNTKGWPGHYDPIHNKYYEDSFISIYAESNEKSPMVYITEKTYDPLIKGHFILPFGSKDIIKYLKLEGFKLPDFIDYSYDSIYDDDERYGVYISEVERLITLPITAWIDHWDNNLDLLKYNQDLFYARDYDTVIDRLNAL